MFHDSIPVICYHRIDEKDPITPGVFESHLSFFKRNGIRTIDCNEVLEILSGTKKRTDRVVLITFDDGYRDFYYNAYPLLKKYNFKATIFLIADHVVSDPNRVDELPDLSYDEIHWLAAEEDYRGFLSLEQILEMKTSGLIEYGGHTYSHSVSLISSDVMSIYRGEKLKWYARKVMNFKKGYPLFRLGPMLSGPRFIPNDEYLQAFSDIALKNRLSSQEIADGLSDISKGEYESDTSWKKRLEQELLLSKERLESLIDQPIISFCWPWGFESKDAKAYLTEAGYKLAFTLERGKNENLDDAMKLKRFSARNKGALWLNLRLKVFNNTLLAAYYDKRDRSKSTAVTNLPYF